MKLAPLFRAFSTEPRIESRLVHTGQHYDDRMSGDFFRDLELPTPDHSLGAGSGSRAQQIATIGRRLDPVLTAEHPSAVLVAGDANSTVASALAAKKLGLFVIHAEAGLRSFDPFMPEEINRRVTDSISDLLLVSEESGCRNLNREAFGAGKMRLVGNLMIDSLHYNLPRAGKSKILDDLGLRGRRFGMVTLHRAANVDDPQKFAGIMDALRTIAADLPLVFPVHPRTRARNGLLDPGPHIRVCDPLGYLDFLCLMSHSAAVLTDSGGIQEETTALRIPCLTLRENTERPATIEEGTNRLAGTSRESILRAWRESLEAPKVGAQPKYWDGQAAGRCVEAIFSAADDIG
jgi:UDP-N-acetylglucosamine 2-epimerase (non-hydrolysing)